MSEIRIGICAGRYGPWRKDFYPAGQDQDDELAFASRADGERVTEPGVEPQEPL